MERRKEGGREGGREGKQAEKLQEDKTEVPTINLPQVYCVTGGSILQAL
jgi:hypothetical protein